MLCEPQAADRFRVQHGAARPYLGGRIELRMSSVCVSPGFCSTGGRDPYSTHVGDRQRSAKVLEALRMRTFLPGVPFAPFPLSLLVLTKTGLSYLTSEDSGGIILLVFQAPELRE